MKIGVTFSSWVMASYIVLQIITEIDQTANDGSGLVCSNPRPSLVNRTILRMLAKCSALSTQIILFLLFPS